MRLLLFLLIYITVITVTNSFENLEILDQPVDINNIKYKNASYGYWNNRGKFVFY